MVQGYFLRFTRLKTEYFLVLDCRISRFLSVCFEDKEINQENNRLIT